MKLWVDDIRIAPAGWSRACNYDEAIALITSNKIEAVSLDHDLGEEKDGADILQFMCQNDKVPDIVLFHTANPVGRAEMESMLEAYRAIGTFDKGPHFCTGQ